MTAEAVQELLNGKLNPIHPFMPQARTYAIVSRRWILGPFKDYVQRHRLATGTLRSRFWDCEKKAAEIQYLGHLTAHEHHRKLGAESNGIFSVRYVRTMQSTEDHVINLAIVGVKTVMLFDSQFFDYGMEPGEHIRSSVVEPLETVAQIWG